MMENCTEETPCILEIHSIEYFKTVFLNIFICAYKTPFCKSGHICICESPLFLSYIRMYVLLISKLSKSSTIYIAKQIGEEGAKACS